MAIEDWATDEEILELARRAANADTTYRFGTVYPICEKRATFYWPSDGLPDEGFRFAEVRVRLSARLVGLPLPERVAPAIEQIRRQLEALEVSAPDQPAPGR